MKARALRTLRELSSLAIATAIVLSVCGVAIASMTSSEIDPADILGIEVPWTMKDGGEREAQLYTSAEGLTEPVTYVADIDVKGWYDRSQRVVQAVVNSAEPIDRHASEVAGPSTVAPARVFSQMLAGRNVLTGVTRSAAEVLPASGEAKVRLIVTPEGETATLLIDRVLEPALSVAQLAPGGLELPLIPAAGPGPVVDGLSRTWGRPGEQVEIFGSGFGDAQQASWVACAGERAEAVSWSDTHVVFTVPAAATSSGYVGVVVGGTSSNGIYFVPFDKPVLDSITPREGEPGTIVTLHGANFGAEPEGGWVSFAGVTAEVVEWSDTEIRVVVPRAAQAGYAGVILHGLSSNGILYAPYGLPSIESVSTRRLTRGLEVIVSGRDFGPAPGVLVLNGTRFTADQWTARRIVFSVPAGLRSGYIGVMRDDLYTSNGVWVNVVPTITSLSKWWSPPGATIAVDGAGFGADPTQFVVTVGGVPAQTTSWTDTRLEVTVPPSASSGYVGVGTNAACSNGRYLVVEHKASIASVTPRRVSAGERITITGTDLGTASPKNRVLIGGVYECAIDSWTSNRIVAVVPGGAESGYVGVIKQNVSSNGVWLTVTP